jgi:hypothetical protein
MTIDELNKLKWQQPFQPFRVVTSENEVFDISRPSLIIVAGRDVNIGLPDPDEPPPRVKDVIWLDIDDIARVEPLASVA